MTSPEVWSDKIMNHWVRPRGMHIASQALRVEVNQWQSEPPRSPSGQHRLPKSPSGVHGHRTGINDIGAAGIRFFMILYYTLQYLASSEEFHETGKRICHKRWTWEFIRRTTAITTTPATPTTPTTPTRPATPTPPTPPTPQTPAPAAATATATNQPTNQPTKQASKQATCKSARCFKHCCQAAAVGAFCCCTHSVCMVSTRVDSRP